MRNIPLSQFLKNGLRHLSLKGRRISLYSTTLIESFPAKTHRLRARESPAPGSRSPLVGMVGLEPTLRCRKRILSPLWDA